MSQASTPNRDLVQAAIALGLDGALGSYPTEREVLEAVLERVKRPVAVDARLLSGLADVYDEAREERVPLY